MTWKARTVFLTLVVLRGGIAYAAAGTDAEPADVEVTLAADGGARFPVVIAPAASDAVRSAAADLARYLSRISDAPFTVAEGDGQAGIAVGRAEDFPEIPVRADFHPEHRTGREDYLLRTHSKGVFLLGATDLGVEHAVWDFLYRLGHRQFFPGETWEIVPSIEPLTAAMDTVQRPDFAARRLSTATSRGAEAFGDREAYAVWTKRNRLGQGWRRSGGHAYGAILRARSAEFEAHPEYLALVDGVRQGSKFCISNPGLRALVVDYALETLQQAPHLDSISMEPSDGGGWCECPECEKQGSISTRVVTLANTVAEAVSRKYPDKFVSILAYNYHCPPPEIQLHPHVLVTVCAGQLTGSWKPMELFDAWAARGANAAGEGFGVFEYFNNIVKNRYLPGSSRTANLVTLQRTIPEYYRRGARRFSSGTSYSNGTVALGAYLAARMLWDVSEADRIDALYRDFLEKSFGPAAGAMDDFYRLVYRLDENDRRMRFTEDLVGRMYRALADALPRADDPAVRTRIQDMILYTRFAELNLGEDYGDVLRFAWKTRERMLVNTYGLFTYPSGPWSHGQLWRLPSDENPYKKAPPSPKHPENSLQLDSTAGTEGSAAGTDTLVSDLLGEAAEAPEPAGKPADFRDGEIMVILENGVKNNRVGDYQIKAFSLDLVPATPLNLGTEPPGRYNFGRSLGGRRVFYTWVDEAPGEITLRIAGGFIWPKRAGNVEITVFSDHAEAADDFVVARDRSIPPDQQEHTVAIPTPYPGLHRIEIEGGPGATTVEPGTDGMAFTVLAGPEHFFRARYTWEGWFYVPRGTTSLSLFAAAPHGEIQDRQGNPIFSFHRPYPAADGTEQTPPTGGGYYTMPVPPGKDGALWKISQARGEWLLLNVPPQVARRPSELLLPREVVEADR